MPETFDMLFFLYVNGGGENHDGTEAMRIVRDVERSQVIDIIQELEDPENFDIDPGEGNFDVHGCVELATVQTHFKDTNILQPQRFTCMASGQPSTFLDEVPVWKRPAPPVTVSDDMLNSILDGDEEGVDESSMSASIHDDDDAIQHMQIDAEKADEDGAEHRASDDGMPMSQQLRRPQGNPGGSSD
jgi:hypothetical protein